MQRDASIGIWEVTVAAFEQRLRLVDGGLWQAPTPCEEWTVRDLVDHAVWAQRRYAGFLGYDVDDAAAWPEVRDTMAAALAGDATFSTDIVTHSMLGDIPKARVLGIVTNDLLVHTWDLARSIGADESLPPEAVAACFDVVLAIPPEIARNPKVYGEPLDTEPDAPLQTRLLAQVGRRT